MCSPGPGPSPICRQGCEGALADDHYGVNLGLTTSSFKPRGHQTLDFIH
jgi:hypothetical protein